MRKTQRGIIFYLLLTQAYCIGNVVETQCRQIHVRRTVIGMDRYMIVTPHTDKECLKLVEWIHAQGYLHHFDWGCGSGEHCGWAILEVDNEDQAILAVPPILRGKAHVIKLNKFKDEDVISLHSSG